MLMLTICAACNAFMIPAMPPTSSALATRAGAVVCAEKEVSPIQGAVVAGGTLGIVFAAYCTSTGSPPTGLAVGIAALLFMYFGAGLIEGQA